MENNLRERHTDIFDSNCEIQGGGRLMKTLLLTICLVFSIVANGLCDCTVMVAGKKAGCNPASDYIGGKSTSANFNLLNDGAVCHLNTPTCSGSLEYPIVYHYDTNNDVVKTCVYLDDGDGVPDESDTQVGNCVAISGSEVSGWITGGTKLTGSVSTANKYWVCVISDDIGTGTWTTTFSSSGTEKRYTNTSFSYSSPPSTLSGTWSLDDSGATSGNYVRIE